MLLGCRFDGGYSLPALLSVQWHEGGGISKVWSGRSRILRVEVTDISRGGCLGFCLG